MCPFNFVFDTLFVLPTTRCFWCVFCCCNPKNDSLLDLRFHLWQSRQAASSFHQKIKYGTESQRTPFLEVARAIRYSGFLRGPCGPWVRSLEVFRMESLKPKFPMCFSKKFEHIIWQLLVHLSGSRSKSWGQKVVISHDGSMDQDHVWSNLPTFFRWFLWQMEGNIPVTWILWVWCFY